MTPWDFEEVITGVDDETEAKGADEDYFTFIALEGTTVRNFKTIATAAWPQAREPSKFGDLGAIMYMATVGDLFEPIQEIDAQATHVTQPLEDEVIAIERFTVKDAPLEKYITGKALIDKVVGRHSQTIAQRIAGPTGHMGLTLQKLARGSAEARSHLRMQERFDELLARWKEDTPFSSSAHEFILHPAYLEIIGMGPAALRFILPRIEELSAPLFPALRAIVGHDAAEGSTTAEEAAKAWLEWGRAQGHAL